MAIPANIEDLVNHRTVESTRIEYKASFNPEPIVRSICAFANDIDNIGGGYIIIGIEEENGSPRFPLQGVPQESIDGILKKLREYCHYIEPLYEPVVEPVQYQGVYLIVIWVSGGYGRPYKAPAHANNRQSVKYYYIRKFSSSVVASPEEERELFYISSSIPFDDRPNLAAEPEDLDLGLMREHLKEIGSSLYAQSADRDLRGLAMDMQLLGGPPERMHPLNVGILMFSEHPERYFRYARIEVVDIPDPTGTNMTEKVFTGPIQRQLRDALAYIRNYVIREAVVKLPDQAEAVRIANYPYEAVDELLSNAVYHRSYQINEPITVRISKNGMEIISFPGFDRSISDAAVESGEIRARSYRNRRIGDFLKELRLIEGRDTSFPNARRALEQNGSPKLRFEMNPERDYLSVTIPLHPYFVASSQKDEDYGRRILDALETGPKTLTELAKAMGYKGITAKLKKTTETMLRERQLVLCVGEDRRARLRK